LRKNQITIHKVINNEHIIIDTRITPTHFKRFRLIFAYVKKIILLLTSHFK